MIVPQVRSLTSVDLEMSATVDPEDCFLGFEAEIGPKGDEGADLFQFEVATPKSLVRGGPRWGRGLFIVQAFSMEAVEDALEGLLAHCHRETWQEVAQALNKELLWEFDNYQEYKSVD